MFLGLRSVVYPVSDLATAGQWYEKALGQAPDSTASGMMGFELGHDRIWLKQEAGELPAPPSGAIPFLAVSDIDTEFSRLTALGASVIEAPARAGGEYWQARLVDPFGNPVGLLGIKADPDQSCIDDQASRTALWTTLMRAFSHESEPSGIGCADRLAKCFLMPDQLAALEDRKNRRTYMAEFFVVGVYEYVTARTHIFDTFFTEALADGFEQIVLLGAGYDSRAVRFSKALGSVPIFEVDAPKTQERKKDCLTRAGYAVPESLWFVPLNFNTGSLSQALDAAGFDPGKKTFFSWEGVTFYLRPDAVAATLDCINTHSEPGSVVAFDFIELWPGIFDAYGVKELIAFNRRHQSGESGNHFAIEQGTLNAFLGSRGFETTQFFSTQDIEACLKQKDAGFSGQVTASFRIVRAKSL